ncbi:MAG: acyl-CoA dehydrogenase family protein [Acidimicrobiia bacterium]
MSTHEVLNQPPPLADHDVVATDAVLLEGVTREQAGWALDELHALGRLAGSTDAERWARNANAYPPVLHTHDRYGHRVDEIEYHPDYHRLMEVAVRHGLHGAPWSDPRAGAHVARAAGFFAWSQAEAGHGCPISMTYSILPALRAEPASAEQWEALLTSRTYDPADAPAPEKRGAIAGMAMTEKQGGSDVRANTSTAVADGDAWRLTGHKWFCSAPGSDLFLMLARTDAGITCFAVPRYLPDGSRNPIRIQRLKDKLGNRSNASGEIEFADAYGRRVGEEGRGIATIIAMVNHTRLDCVIGSSAGMRAALVQALHHTRHRAAFGKCLADQPLMQEVLTDLAIESEAATTLMLRLAGAYDAVAGDQDTSTEASFRRLATAVAKYWVCKRQPVFVAEALECLGGAGYVEESGLPRLFRESPLNGIWEGSGNVIALDVLRAVSREPGTLAAVRAEIALAAGADRRLDRAVADLDASLADLASTSEPERGARRLTERLALTLQGSLLVRHAPAAVADAFCATRLGGDRGVTFGTLPAGVDTAAVLARSFPA